MTDPLVEIEKVLEELYEGIEEGEDLCATFEIADREDWVQVTGNELNLFWPYDEEEAQEFEGELRELLPRCQLIDVEEGTYATYEIELLMVEDMADLIDWILTDVLEVPEDYELETEIFEM